MHYPKLVRSVGILVTLCTVPIFAQTTTTWLGGTSAAFNTAGNWSNGLPSATNAVVFDSNSTANLSPITLTGNITAQGISVSNPGANVGISVNGATNITLSVGAGGINVSGTRDLSITRGTSTILSFLSPIASQDWNVATGRALNISTTSEYDIIPSGVTVTLKGGGTIGVTATTFDIGQGNANSFVVNNATLTTSGNLRLGQTTTGVNGVGGLTITSGSVTTGGLLQFGSAAGASGNLVVQGGSTLSTTTIKSVTGAGASTATFDGATLKATLADAVLIDSSLGSFTTSIGASGLTVNTNNLNVSINAAMGNKSGATGVLTKSGAGTLTLSGANTFTGATTVSTGTLALGLNGSLASTAYSVANGATFDVSAKSSYNLSAVNLTLGAGTGANGFFNAGTGALTLGGGLTVNLASATPDASYNLLDFGSQTGDFSSVALTGTFNGSLALTAADTWTGTIGGYDWTFSETTGILSSATAAIPEPSSFALLAGVMGLGLAGLRRRGRA